MPDLGRRLARLRARLEKESLHALLVSQPGSRYYLSDYTGEDIPPLDSAGYLLVSRDEAYLLTDPRTSEQAQEEAPEFELVVYKSSSVVIATMKELIASLPVTRVGFEGDHLSYAMYCQLREALDSGIELVPTQGLVAEMTAIKEAEELERIKEAVLVTDAAFERVVRTLRPGQTEKWVAWALEEAIRESGAEALPFPVIAASGPNSSKPHARPSDREIRANEALVLDFGARVHGYSSDITRTVCLGEAPSKLRDIYEVVREAQARVEKEVRPGMTGRQADAIARQVVSEAGYGEAFCHGTGHGVGIATHEAPRLSTYGECVLEPGMVFSVEPGIYLQGWGGVRIEDLVLLEETGARVLTTAPKVLEVFWSKT